jgi:hypothetical protein
MAILYNKEPYAERDQDADQKSHEACVSSVETQARIRPKHKSVISLFGNPEVSTLVNVYVDACTAVVVLLVLSRRFP